VSNGLARYYERAGRVSRIHPISRLDRWTSGVILFAKDSYTANLLGGSLRAGNFIKEYLGVSRGAPEPRTGSIDLPIGRVDGFIMLRAVRCGGKRSLTFYETLYSTDGLTLMLLRPVTGRTHQLRVHLSAIGCPLLSDGLYGPAGPAPQPTGPAPQPGASGVFEGFDGRDGGDASLIGRQALHSYRLTFPHPYKDKKIIVTGEVPADFKSLLTKLSVPDGLV